MTESQNPPKFEESEVSSATFPSMKSKILATIITKPANRNSPRPRARPAPAFMMTPTSVSTFGWMRNRTQKLIMARRGYMQSQPIVPVNVILNRTLESVQPTI